MRHPAPLPAGSALPLRTAPHFVGRPPVTLAPKAVAEFNDLLHALHPDAPHVDADALASVARWLLDLPPDQAEDLLQARLGRRSTERKRGYR